MKPTRKRFLALIGLIGFLSAISLSRLVVATSGSLISVRPATPIATAVMCGALLWWTILVRRRLLHIQRAKHEALHRAKGGASVPFVMREKPLHPIVAARTLALAFAVSRAGAWVCGWYGGIAVSFMSHLGSEDVRWRLAYAVITSVLAVALVAIALWLERSCKLPTPPASAEASPA